MCKLNEFLGVFEMKLAKIIAVGLSAVMLTTGFSVSALAAQTTDSTVSTPGFKTYDALYADAG